MELYARVRRACYVEGMSIHEASRMFGVDRKTVRNEQDVRQTLRHHGYAKIRGLRFVDRGAKEYWVGHASKDGHDYRVFAEAGTGKPYRRVQLDNDRASAADVRRSLRAAGYRKIQNLRFVDRGKRDLYVALAMRGGQQYRVWLDAEDAEIRRAKRVN